MTANLHLSLIRLTQGWHVRAYDEVGRFELVHQHICESRKRAVTLRRRIRGHLDKGGHLDHQQWYKMPLLFENNRASERASPRSLLEKLESSRPGIAA